MEPRRILILDGHPDPDPGRGGHARAAAAREGAAGSGHEVHAVSLPEMDFPVLTTRQDWEAAPPSERVRAFQDELVWAEHLVIIYPLWLGMMPARLKALFEQAFRPAFAFGGKPAAPGAGRLKGRSARIIVTMGMPAFIYRTIFFAHSLKALKSGILMLVGFGPVRDTVFGGVETRSDRARLLKRVAAMGARAA